ncbi:hypothetical protein VFPFJ_02113 [Purpureocillium lilacinum]|uniref:Uncharacterized protein n=1 Tax=Purpureocillium lilacinum TaxID=33203 RepID=A0A179GN28_PURLI|nr:hypothetical protein VFPFJ_02113 [Purpureocillium lilacinum]OAQ79294.1 hypothetical protein VFPBJ_07415 [Purpureocillium lilacinum]OAQ92952.1 hypothetical protein VFPFJ_02113 [Purpureocillium lilacinum]
MLHASACLLISATPPVNEPLFPAAPSPAAASLAVPPLSAPQSSWLIFQQLIARASEGSA